MTPGFKRKTKPVLKEKNNDPLPNANKTPAWIVNPKDTNFS
jgi:hypothetical protein